MLFDRFMFKWPYEINDALTAYKVCLAFWLLGFVLVCGFIYLRRDSFQPSDNLLRVPLALLANLLAFSFLVLGQLTVESMYIWDDKSVRSLQDLTAPNLRPWILGHVALGCICMVLVVIIWGQKEIDAFIFFSAIPMAISLFGLFLLGILWWPQVFSYPVVTSAVMLSQNVFYGILSIPIGILVLFCIFWAFEWALT